MLTVHITHHTPFSKTCVLPTADCNSRDVTCRHMTWQSEHTQVNPSENPKTTFFNLATLTFDLWPWPSNSFEILSTSIPPTNFGSVHQMVQLWERWQTDTWNRFYTLDCWRGREWVFLNHDSYLVKFMLATFGPNDMIGAQATIKYTLNRQDPFYNLLTNWFICNK